MSDTRSLRPGRPREFDVDEALERALDVFWRNGYEGTTLTDLTDAMRISRPSMYAAFGSKEELFEKALARYSSGPAGYSATALDQPTARAVAEAFLRGSVETTTLPDRPPGCLGVQGALATGGGARGVHDLLVAWRNNARASLEKRFRRAVDEADLPADADPALLAHYIITVSQGVAVQAATGAGRDELNAVVDVALRNFP